MSFYSNVTDNNVTTTVPPDIPKPNIINNDVKFIVIPLIVIILIMFLSALVSSILPYFFNTWTVIIYVKWLRCIWWQKNVTWTPCVITYFGFMSSIRTNKNGNRWTVTTIQIVSITTLQIFNWDLMCCSIVLSKNNTVVNVYFSNLLTKADVANKIRRYICALFFFYPKTIFQFRKCIVHSK